MGKLLLGYLLFCLEIFYLSNGQQMNYNSSLKKHKGYSSRMNKNYFIKPAIPFKVNKNFYALNFKPSYSWKDRKFATNFTREGYTKSSTVSTFRRSGFTHDLKPHFKSYGNTLIPRKPVVIHPLRPLANGSTFQNVHEYKKQVKTGGFTVKPSFNHLSAWAKMERLYPKHTSRLWKYEKKVKAEPAMTLEFAIGCLQTFLAVILFGTTYVPVKKYNAFDGIFCLFLLAASTFMVGCIVFAIQGFEPKVYPLAILSGVIWTIGNTAVIPIIKRVSLAVGYLVWNTTNCIIGWGITYFGLFGIIAKPAAIPWMNFSGVAIVLMGGIIMAFVEKAEEEETSNTSSKNSIEDDSIEKLPTPMMIKYPIKLRIDDFPSEKINPEPTIVAGNKKLNFDKQRIIGVVMAALAGCVFGIVWTPIFYMQDHADEFDNAPKDLLPYLFSNYLGIFITATLEFAIYSAVKKNKPKISPELVLPGLASGIIFGTAQVFMFGATQALTASITYPIVAMMHGLVAASWSTFYFKEVQGKRNYIIMATAVCVNLTGSTLIALSK